MADAYYIRHEHLTLLRADNFNKNKYILRTFSIYNHRVIILQGK